MDRKHIRILVIPFRISGFIGLGLIKKVVVVVLLEHTTVRRLEGQVQSNKVRRHSMSQNTSRR